MTCKILAIDDEENCLLCIMAILESSGYDLVTAQGGKQGLEILYDQSAKIDLILLDLMMPDIHGFEVLTRIKNDVNLRNIPVIIQSAIANKEHIAKCSGMAGVYFLSKPYEVGLLLSSVQVALEADA
jgi:CheY-like chemotaxis protein